MVVNAGLMEQVEQSNKNVDNYMESEKINNKVEGDKG
jgi:hypothetical protein